VRRRQLFRRGAPRVRPEIAKVHTIECDAAAVRQPPCSRQLTANWNGLLGCGHRPCWSRCLSIWLSNGSARCGAPPRPLLLDAASGPGSRPRQPQIAGWPLTNPDERQRRHDHFGSPLNFPEKFVTVEPSANPPCRICSGPRRRDRPSGARRLPVIETFPGQGDEAMRRARARRVVADARSGSGSGFDA